MSLRRSYENWVLEFLLQINLCFCKIQNRSGKYSPRLSSMAANSSEKHSEKWSVGFSILAVFHSVFCLNLYKLLNESVAERTSSRP